MMKRYCIGCVHLWFEGKQISHGSEYTGSWTSEQASIACQLGRWKTHLEEGPIDFDLEKAMESAQTCPDYKERPAPDVEA